MKDNIITFGSATRDIFLRAKEFLIGDFKPDHIKKEILLPVGLKINVREIHFHSGGGGTNTAATFSAQGLKTAYCGVIGNDPEGEAVLKELKKKGIETNLIRRTGQKPTNISVIFSTPEERTILVYKGASTTLTKKQIPWQKIKTAEWFYLAPLSEKLNNLFPEIIDFAKKNKIKVMVNPGNAQLKMSAKVLHPLLKKIDILILNQKEGQLLIKNNSLKGTKLLSEIKKIFPGILIITNGENKVSASANGRFYSIMPKKVKVVDRTGAGDAFGSGFLSGFIRSKGDINKSLRLAADNAAACIKKWGAKEGILRK